MVRTVSVLGATGSIGKATLDVLQSQQDRVAVDALVGGRDVAALAQAARRMQARVAVIADPDAYQDLKAALAGSGIEAAAGPSAVVEAAARPVDWTMAAISGTAGLRPSIAAARRGGTLALATKECIVSAGTVFLDAVKAGGGALLPVDSEHNAIFQSLAGAAVRDIKKMVLTASGGPFRSWPLERIATARLEDALQHPTWSMGAKITIDSATMMNKGLELIEASYLFGVESGRIEIVVHPQSIVHGMVEFRDGSVVAGLAPADMRVAISHALGYPDRIETAVGSLDLIQIGTLTFEAPDEKRFPALKVARAALERGDGAIAALNAANEVAVEAFLARSIRFIDIMPVVIETLEQLDRRNGLAAPRDLEQVTALDDEARKTARNLMQSISNQTATQAKALP
ncbi:1-deoxy-D-xylulose 5-phosphate reductoisomerase [Agaricicola taiwanensis]|uniref:1-deoxy-D-xylulose 5-phosphate reductoisomerase n=1 Tax=Agaricicola taiwanensis TaxID=591372 RepID=A0A8J2YI32_9RHOB|nr:1-deoxy-D-xylulose-5-phosphate reductoisomerase [Agaricicola taiwanensis]GGE44348.1 1-deoxy-D-xylulose 5-phosphate reductoisomerase [Agaricicola taiwanensis]